MRRTVPVSVVALHTVGWVGPESVDWIAVTDAFPGVEAGQLLLVGIYGLRAVAVESLVVAGAICYRIGRDSDLSSVYGRFLRRLAVAGAVGGAAGGVAFVAVTSALGVLSGPSTAVPAVGFVATVAGLRGAIVVSVVGLAGGALGQFRGDDAGAGPVTVGG